MSNFCETTYSIDFPRMKLAKCDFGSSWYVGVFGLTCIEVVMDQQGRNPCTWCGGAAVALAPASLFKVRCKRRLDSLIMLVPSYTPQNAYTQANNRDIKEHQMFG